MPGSIMRKVAVQILETRLLNKKRVDVGIKIGRKKGKTVFERMPSPSGFGE